MKTFKEDGDKIIKLFKKTRRKLLMSSIISILVTLLAIGIVGLKLFYPFHFAIGVSIYIFSFIPIFLRIYQSKKSFKKFHTYSFVASFYKKERRRLIVAFVGLLMLSVFFVLRPMDEDPFKNMSDGEIRTYIEEELYQSIVIIDYLETSGNELLSALDTDEENLNTTKTIENAFSNFLNAVIESEILTERHRYFDMIPYRLRKERATSFAITYSLYVKKYEVTHRLMLATSLNPYKKKILNQFNEVTQSKDVYNDMIKYFYNLKTRLRLSGGSVYMNTISEKRQEAYGGSFQVLFEKARESYKYLLINFNKTLSHSPEALADGTNQKMFDMWFPIQKGVANTMGHIMISPRGKDKFIQEDQILEMEKNMEPGDVMLQRRNWYASNVGIPGFWTHSALYTGDLEKMSKYFAEVFPYRGYDNYQEYLMGELPDIYNEYNSTDENGDDYAVIEAIEPGVVLQSIVTSAHADFVAVLRPRLTKVDKLEALTEAFINRGKPYDYNFDFDTRDSLVCSELIFAAYFERLPDKNGLHFETSLVNGRKIVSPLDMAKKFKAEYSLDDREFDFVYFLKGSEETQNASVATEDKFLESVDWNKFTFMQE